MKCKYCNYENKPGDKYCENCGASLETSSGAMDDISMASMPAASSVTMSNAYEQTGTSSAQSNPYGQTSSYGQSNSFGQPTGYGQQNGYERPNNYGQQQYGYGQPNMYNGPKYGCQGLFNESDNSPKYVSFGEAIKLYFKNFFNFKGRSTRSEFWFSFLFSIILGIVLDRVLVGLFSALISNRIETSSPESAFKAYNDFARGVYTFTLVSALIGIVLSIPSWACGVRRLHDAGKSGLWILLLCPVFIPAYLKRIPGIDSSMISEVGYVFAIVSLVGLILNIVFWCLSSDGVNQWGLPAKPKY